MDANIYIDEQTGLPVTLPPGVSGQDVVSIVGMYGILEDGTKIPIDPSQGGQFIIPSGSDTYAMANADALAASPEWLIQGAADSAQQTLMNVGGMGLVANSATAASQGLPGDARNQRLIQEAAKAVNNNIDLRMLPPGELNKILAGADPATTTAGGSGGGGGSSGGWYDNSSYSGGYGNGYYDGPRVQYANGWIPPMFGGNYSYQEWLRMQYPPDPNDYGGPAQLPQLPKSFNLNVFGDNGPPGNPFTSGYTGGGYNGGNYGGYGGYNANVGNDPNLPLAKRLYQKFSGTAADLRQRGTPGSPPTASQYDQAQRQQQRDSRQNERKYQLYNAAMSARQNPIWGFGGYFGDKAVNDLRYNQYSEMPLQGLQYLLNANADPKKFETPNKYQKQLQQMYRQINGNGDLSYDTLRDSLFSGGRKSLMASLFQSKQAPQAQYNNDGLYTGMKTPRSQWADPYSQTSSMGMLLQSLYGMTMDPSMAYSRMMAAQQQMGNWANRQMSKNPNNYGDLRKWMRNKVM
jgi:hypothetical protein